MHPMTNKFEEWRAQFEYVILMTFLLDELTPMTPQPGSEKMFNAAVAERTKQLDDSKVKLKERFDQLTPEDQQEAIMYALKSKSYDYCI